MNRKVYQYQVHRHFRRFKVVACHTEWMVNVAADVAISGLGMSDVKRAMSLVKACKMADVLNRMHGLPLYEFMELTRRYARDVAFLEAKAA